MEARAREAVWARDAEAADEAAWAVHQPVERSESAVAPNAATHSRTSEACPVRRSNALSAARPCLENKKGGKGLCLEEMEQARWVWAQ